MLYQIVSVEIIRSVLYPHNLKKHGFVHDISWTTISASEVTRGSWLVFIPSVSANEFVLKVVLGGEMDMWKGDGVREGCEHLWPSLAQRSSVAVFAPVTVRCAKVLRQPLNPIPLISTTFFLTFGGRLRYLSRTGLDHC